MASCPAKSSVCVCVHTHTQEFWIGLEFPRPGFESVRVTVKLRRSATTDRTESADPRWPWSVKSAHGEGEHKVRMAAMASGVFNASARLGGAPVKTTLLTNFFTPPKPPGAPAPPGTAPPPPPPPLPTGMQGKVR